jgi:integrase/recombinase XerD
MAIIGRTPATWRRCLRAFDAWLVAEREMAPSSITVRIRSIHDFLVAQSVAGGVRSLRRLGITDVEDFFIRHGTRHGPASTRSMQAALRLFFRFAALRRWVRDDLADAVPRMRSYRLSGVPRGVDSPGVRQLVAASRERSLRDHAIVLLVAVYGVRRGQVASLRLQDVDWRQRRIEFRPQKGGKGVLHALTPSVAAALSGYIQRERPRAACDAVFLRSTAPHLPLSPSAITQVVRNLFVRLALKGTPRGPHALRHAFATRLLHEGQPLEVIADLLGHRSLQSAAIYAKVDHPRLLEVACDWPEVCS